MARSLKEIELPNKSDAFTGDLGDNDLWVKGSTGELMFSNRQNVIKNISNPTSNSAPPFILIFGSKDKDYLQVEDDDKNLRHRFKYYGSARQPVTEINIDIAGRKLEPGNYSSTVEVWDSTNNILLASHTWFSNERKNVNMTINNPFPIGVCFLEIITYCNKDKPRGYLYSMLFGS